MDYRVEPARVASGSRLRIVACLAFVVALIGVAVGTAERAPGANVTNAKASSAVAAAASPEGTSPASPDGTSPSAMGVTPAVESAPRAVRRRSAITPSIVRCSGIARGACLRIAWAAVTATDGATTPGADLQAITGIDVRASLICNSDEDCPRARTAKLTLLGSAAVHLGAPAAVAWVNVGQPLDGSGDAADGLAAWVIRWYP